MSASALISGYGQFSKLTSSHDDDWVDRLNHIYTVVLLCIFALFVTGGQFVGKPINCWAPAEYTGSHVAYAESYCWIKNTYFIAMDDAIPVEHHKRDSEELTYYQWVPIILLFMAFLFKFPCVMWRLFSGGSGVNLEQVVNMTLKSQMETPDSRDVTVKNIALYLDRWLTARRTHSRNLAERVGHVMSKMRCFYCSKPYGKYVIGLYLIVKLLYVANVVTQFFLLNAFLGDWFNLYGLEVISGLAGDHDWKESKRFPRVTLCDYDIRQLQNIQRHTIQCVLPINLFNEKIFIFLWFWFVFVAVCTVGNFLAWLWRSLLHRNNTSYIKKHLKQLGLMATQQDKRAVEVFTSRYLRDDGNFVLRLVAKNSNDILLSDLLQQLWQLFKKNDHYAVEDQDESVV